MAIENTALWAEIVAIFKSGAKPVHYHWVLQIVANGATYEATKVLSIDLVRNYDNDYSDSLMVEFAIPSGTYQHLIVPYRANLLCTLIGTPLGEVSGGVQTNMPLPTQQMRGVLINTRSKVLEGNDSASASLNAMNLTGIERVQLQLVDLTLEQVRMKGVGGNYTNTVPADALKHMMVAALNDLKLDTDDDIVGVDMVEPDNTQPRSFIMIPHGTPFVEVPDYIHNHCGGVYSTGFGFYLQNGMWYVYPTFDITRFDKAPKSVTFINVPKNRFPEVERTYRVTANQLIVLVTGDTVSKDDSESLIHNQGNGTRFQDAKRMMDGSLVEVKDNVATAYRVKNNNEYLTEKRSNGLNHAPLSPSRATDNPYREMSLLARRAGRHTQVLWEHSNPSLITPDMPCKYIYLVNGQVVEAEGVVIGLHSYTYLAGEGLSASRHANKTSVMLFIDKSLPWIEDEPTIDTSALADVNASTAT